jgi:hypothetical protein
MRISRTVLIVVLTAFAGANNRDALAENSYPALAASGQTQPSAAGAPDSAQWINGPSSSDVYRRPVVNSMLYPPTAYSSPSNQPAVYPPGTYPPGSDIPQYQSLSNQANAGYVPPDITMPALGNKLTEATWYTRVDYFHWNERMDGVDFVNEYGTLFTLGYMRRVGIERFHGAAFGATMIYKGAAEFYNGDGTYSEEPLTSATGYLGVLAEYDLHLEPDCCPNLSFFVGVGTRFWIRDLKDGVTDYGNMSYGYEEFWWTFYPYIGVEERRSLSGAWEFYYAGRIGCTAMTYQYATWGSVPLYPKVGLTGQLELGVRSQHVFVSMFSEVFSWTESDEVEGFLQPDSRQFTVGIKSGFCF